MSRQKSKTRDVHPGAGVKSWDANNNFEVKIQDKESSPVEFLDAINNVKAKIQDKDLSP